MSTDTKPIVVWLCLEWPRQDHTGGVAHYSYRLATEIASLVDLTIVTEVGGDPIDGARMILIPRAKGRLERYYLQAVRLRRIVMQFGSIDVVHAFGDDWALPNGPWKHVRHFLGLSISEARSSKGLRKLNHYVLAGLEKVSEWRADHRIAIGPESFKAFRCDTLMPPVTRLEPTGVPKTEKPSFVFLGSFEGRKRGWMAEKALTSVADRATLTVFGPEEDAKNWPDSVVHRAGALDAEVQEAIESAWALLSMSSYEGFGIPIYESTAMGTAVIATPNPGADFQADLVGNSEALKLVTNVDEASVAVFDRIASGPDISGDARAAQVRAVDSLLRDASSARLLERIYAR